MGSNPTLSAKLGGKKVRYVRQLLFMMAGLSFPSVAAAEIPERVVLEPGYVLQTDGLVSFVSSVCEVGPMWCARLKRTSEAQSKRLEGLTAAEPASSDSTRTSMVAKKFIFDICLGDAARDTDTDAGQVFHYDDAQIAQRARAYPTPEQRLDAMLPKTAQGRLALARLIRQAVADFPG